MLFLLGWMYGESRAMYEGRQVRIELGQGEVDLGFAENILALLGS